MTWIRCGKCGFYGATFMPGNSCPNCQNKATINLDLINAEAKNLTTQQLKERAEMLLAEVTYQKAEAEKQYAENQKKVEESRKCMEEIEKMLASLEAKETKGVE